MTGSSITERDLRALLDVVSPEAVASSGAEMPDQVFRGLAELIPCTSVNFYALDQHRRTGGPGQELLLQEGLFPPWTPEIDALFWRAWWACAKCRRDPQVVETTVTTWQDLHSEREYATHPMAEYHRRSGFWHELIVRLPTQGKHERHMMLTRDASDAPFSERDQLILTLLRPHLINIRDNIEAHRGTAPVLTPRQLELLRRVATGDTNRQAARDLGLSEATVRKHLENIYTRLDVHSRTEALTKVGHLLAS